MRPALEFFVQGVAHGQPRVKAARRGKFTTIYTPRGSHEDWKAAVRAECLKAWGGAEDPKQIIGQWSGPLRVDLTFWFPRPKGHFRSNGELKPSAPVWHTGKPDRDNCDKLILDTLTQVGLWPDDCAVCDGRVRKFYSDPTHPCGCAIRVSECSTE